MIWRIWVTLGAFQQARHLVVKPIAGPRRGLGALGGDRLLGATIVAARAGERIPELTQGEE